MKLTSMQKMKIDKLIKTHAIDDIYHEDFVDILGKKNCSDLELFNFFGDKLLEIFTKGEENSEYIEKYVNTLSMQMEWAKDYLDAPAITNFYRVKKAYEDYRTKHDVKTDSSIMQILKISENYILKLLEDKKEEKPILKEEVSNDIPNNDELLKLKEKCDKLQTFLDRKQNENRKFVAKVKELEEIISAKDSEISNLNDKLSNSNVKLLEEELDKLTTLLNAKDEAIVSLEDTIQADNEKISDLKQNLMFKSSQIEKMSLEKTNAYEKKEAENKLDKEILTLILDDTKTIAEIKEILNANDFPDLKLEDIKASLKRLSRTFNLRRKYSTYLDEKYGVCSPIIVRNKSLSLYVDDSIDILLISDLHCTDFNDYDTVSTYEKMYNYCINNRISLIANLGAFFDVRTNGIKSLDTLRDIYGLLDGMVKYFPKEKSIKHLILGGNHDESLLNYGFDPLDYVAEMRDDIVSLGYRMAAIRFANNDRIMLHHIAKKFSTDTDIVSSLKEAYLQYNRNRDESYIDFLGHTHSCVFNASEHYCLVPSYTRDFVQDGALHLKIYFDNDKKIKYMEMLPLTYDKELKPTAQIIYKK